MMYSGLRLPMTVEPREQILGEYDPLSTCSAALPVLTDSDLKYSNCGVWWNHDGEICGM